MQALLAGRVILASASPRRYQIIKQLGLDVEVIASNYDENLDRSKYCTHWEYVQDLARIKVQMVDERLKNDPISPSLIIGADTLVTINNSIYGKPKDESEAFQMLSVLANKEHIVYTGVCLKTPRTEVTFHESAKVKFGDLSEAEIRAYIKTGECLDKAGAYGIQGVGGCLIEKINGDVYTVMGMPLYSTVKHLNRIFK